MVRTAINILSPIAALATVWVSLQGFGLGAEEDPPAAPPAAAATTTHVTPATTGLLPELASVSRILETAASQTLGETVPESVKRLLIANDAVLLIPEPAEAGGGL